MTLRVSPEAQADILEAVNWYKDQQPDLGMDFVSEIEAVFERIEAGPLRFRMAFRQLRIALVRRFPYAVYFIPDGDDVVVVGVLHQKRDQKLARKRLEPKRGDPP